MDVSFKASELPSGAELDPELLKKAVSDEIAECEKFHVGKEVLVELCLEVTGKPPVPCRYGKLNKGEEDNPCYRVRMVAQRFDREELKHCLQRRHRCFGCGCWRIQRRRFGGRG